MTLLLAPPFYLESSITIAQQPTCWSHHVLYIGSLVPKIPLPQTIAVPFHPSSGETPWNGFRWILTEGYDRRLDSGPSGFSLSEEEGEGWGR